jgi:hypothetical protein
LITPANDVRIVDEHYIGVGRVTISPALSTARAPTEVIQFDLNDDGHRNYLDVSLTRNAQIWKERRHGVLYWGPIDDRKDFEAVYKFSLSFPVRSASLHASLNVAAADARGVLEISSDRDRTWREVIRGSTTWPNSAPVDISKRVRGARTIFVRARLKGRDDHDGSAMAQFLRTSTIPDGHIGLKSLYVFDLRVYDRDVPVMTGAVRFNDGWSQRLWIDPDGLFEVERDFQRAGKYRGTIEVRADPLEPLSKTFQIRAEHAPRQPDTPQKARE